MIEIITSPDGWGVCKVDGRIISEGHDVRYSPFLNDLIEYLHFELSHRELSDENMEEGNYG